MEIVKVQDEAYKKALADYEAMFGGLVDESVAKWFYLRAQLDGAEARLKQLREVANG